MTQGPVKIAVLGCAGRMGRMVLRAVVEAPGAALAAATVRSGSADDGQSLGGSHGQYIGQDAGALIGAAEPLGTPISGDAAAALACSEVAIDFTPAAPAAAHAALAAEAGTAMVIGSTGFDAAQLRAIDAAAARAPVVRAGNMSLGVNLMTALVEQVARALGPEWDVEIVEMHHNQKADAPSGTALMFGEAAAAGRGAALDALAERGRDGLTGPREPGRIGFAALRGGDVVGEHDVIFAGPGERVVLRHLAADRMIFARGAVKAALWVRGRPAGAYDMRDVLGLTG